MKLSYAAFLLTFSITGVSATQAHSDNVIHSHIDSTAIQMFKNGWKSVVVINR
ncbi:hypothetical protein QUF74_03285 [Candidatus Halobeggiatoa sp. HSG11]|nr:hypothetical protein [Candidatus Halobeggiatoa sp. HSG11]